MAPAPFERESGRRRPRASNESFSRVGPRGRASTRGAEGTGGRDWALARARPHRRRPRRRASAPRRQHVPCWRALRGTAYWTCRFVRNCSAADHHASGPGRSAGLGRTYQGGHVFFFLFFPLGSAGRRHNSQLTKLSRRGRIYPCSNGHTAGPLALGTDRRRRCWGPGRRVLIGARMGVPARRATPRDDTLLDVAGHMHGSSHPGRSPRTARPRGVRC